jgi:hypothetical protein
MADRPAGSDLLRTAREELLGRILPHTPDRLRYQLLMIANAMAIAARELDDGARLASKEQQALSGLLDEDPGGDHARTLARCIRAGDFDRDPACARLQAALLALTLDKLALSNPKAVSHA